MLGHIPRHIRVVTWYQGSKAYIGVGSGITALGSGITTGGIGISSLFIYLFIYLFTQFNYTDDQYKNKKQIQK